MANINGIAGNEFMNGDIDPLNLNDVLNFNWSSGDDTMLGGLGSDTYQVNSAGDVAAENPGAGYDTILSRSSTFDMSTNAVQVEAITLDNTPTQLVILPGGGFGLIPAAVSAVGNALGNFMYGNDRDNTLSGMDGNDSIYGNNGNDTLDGGNGDDYVNGGSGNDTMIGGSGNDTLFGGLGDDSMNGGLGSDTYYLDSAGDSTVGEIIFGGTDQVYSSVNHTLATWIENLTLTGTAATGTGNALANVIVGNSSANTLTGNDGNDTLRGGAGNDVLSGGNGNDVVNGETGLDTLTGGAGADQFTFTSSGALNADTMTDFSHVDDTIVLGNALDVGLVGALSPGLKGLAFTGGNVVGNTLSAAWYFEGVGSTGAGTGLSGIYVDTLAGEIYYDPTSGVAGDNLLLGRVNFAIAATLDNTDFILGA